MSVVIAPPPSYAFYGKIPSVGDFISKDIPPPYVRHIDEWFSAGMTILSLSEPDWLGNYLTAPVWSFVISPDVWGAEYLYGALMPSVDSVGRYFPFIALLNGTLLTDIDSALIACLPSLTNELPVVLQGHLLPEEIGDFLTQHVTASAFNIDTFASFDLTGLSPGRSYWWCTTHESELPISIIHNGSPTQQLFKQLFFDAKSL